MSSDTSDTDSVVDWSAYWPWLFPSEDLDPRLRVYFELFYIQEEFILLLQELDLLTQELADQNARFINSGTLPGAGS